MSSLGGHDHSVNTGLDRRWIHDFRKKKKGGGGVWVYIKENVVLPNLGKIPLLDLCYHFTPQDSHSDYILLAVFQVVKVNQQVFIWVKIFKNEKNYRHTTSQAN